MSRNLDFAYHIRNTFHAVCVCSVYVFVRCLYAICRYNWQENNNDSKLKFVLICAVFNCCDDKKSNVKHEIGAEPSNWQVKRFLKRAAVEIKLCSV